ncbi:MAG: hypothetical protein DRH37_08485 [Deltaproteobacteria bacterium]|nr:MAG: hypothetical protein DRH37_08485 [Deltaproteobacteria bacterium]
MYLFLRSGDLGSLDEDGYLSITGRIKDILSRPAANVPGLSGR